jgi:hypothetical protein
MCKEATTDKVDRPERPKPRYLLISSRAPHEFGRVDVDRPPLNLRENNGR